MRCDFAVGLLRVGAQQRDASSDARAVLIQPCYEDGRLVRADADRLLDQLIGFDQTIGAVGSVYPAR
jgi:hypothetical protein